MENGDSTCEPRAKRQKTNHRSAVFERLKQLKGKGSKNKYEVSEVENVYEVVDEKEYSKTVLNRQDDDWIVDDDGSGYFEDGREIFDDDLDSESLAAASKSGENRKRKKNVSKSAVKGNIQAMLSSMPEKKKETVNLDQDDILSDVLSSMDDNTSSKNKSKTEESFLQDSMNQSAKDYLKHFCAPKPLKVKLKSVKIEKKKEAPTVLKELSVENNIIMEEPTIIEEKMSVDESHEEIDFDKTEEEQKPAAEVQSSEYDDVTFDDDFNFDGINENDETCQESEGNKSRNEITEQNLISGWETMQNGVENDTEDCSIMVDNSELPLIKNSDGEQVFRFFWWDAYEDSYRQPGVAFLFGKTYVETAKSYVSCSVVVRNIERKIYLLPRPFFMKEGTNIETDQPVKMINVYHEFNDNIADSLKIQQFRSRKVTKKYAFNPEIPTQSDYLEIRYSAKSAPLPKTTKGRTFSHVFGTETSFLEILLLERKIKGPCWLEVKNPKSAQNPISWCKFEVNCTNASDLAISIECKNKSPPPLVVATLNIRTIVNKNLATEIVMMGCLIHNKYFVDKQPPNPPFQQHFCVLTKPSQEVLPLGFHDALKNYKGTQVQKCDSERALLNYFLLRFQKIDPDLIIGHDIVDFHLGMLCARLNYTKATQWSRFGRLKRTTIPTNSIQQKYLMVGRLICDLKISARELIKSRSYDFETLCQTILKLKEGDMPVLESNDIVKMFGNSGALLKLISLTMQEAAYLTKMMFELNAMPLALQITNIAGNIMSKTLQGGRAQRNEYLLLHAFTEKNYLAPDKQIGKKGKANEADIGIQGEEKQSGSSRKKPTYAGGLVLDPKVGFYDRLILLMDFNSLYPSIIQEYNICFTTMAANLDTETMLSTASSDPGILPTEIRKLVESRRQVKQLMGNSNISSELRMQYNIRQLALKLTANSMYGCLGFANSRFFAKHLASLVTMKGRDILMHTKDLVQGLGFEVIYGDTDSIMINTKILDYDQVFKIGNTIKQAVNKSYRQVELDVDGVFKYMLLLKKKKYAAVTLAKNKNGELICQQEHKGLDIVRRDWSMLASEVGKMVLNHILSDQSADERIENIQTVLGKVASDLRDGKVPLQLLVITKQLTKNPALYTDKTPLSHVLVALRYNSKGGKPLGPGDTVPYVICEDGSTASTTQRAYHVEELRHSDQLKIDTKYYLAQQIHPVVSRLCEPIEGLDAYHIANALGLDPTAFKQVKPKHAEERSELTLDAPVKKFSGAKPFEFTCQSCKEVNTVPELYTNKELWLTRCANKKCGAKPYLNLASIENKFMLDIKNYVEKYYDKTLICEDPLCPNETSTLPKKFVGKYPVCNVCAAGAMYRKYSEKELYEQISFYKHICDLNKMDRRHISEKVDECYQKLKESIDYFLSKSGYAVINLTTLYKFFYITEVVDKSNDLEDAYQVDDAETEDF